MHISLIGERAHVVGLVPGPQIQCCAHLVRLALETIPDSCARVTFVEQLAPSQAALNQIELN